MPAHKLLSGLVAIFALIIMGSVAIADHKQPSGTFTFHGESIGFILGGGTGSGTLLFKGQEYHFSLSGLSAGGVGIEGIRAWGDVYNLSYPSQFAGTYAELATGVTVGDKGLHNVLWVKNDKGVTMAVHASKEGFGMGVSAKGFVVSIKK